MKRHVIFLLLLMSGFVWAQDVVRDTTTTADTVESDENVIGGRPQRSNAGRKADVLGAPVYYNLDGSVRTADGYRGNPRADYVRPRHHWRNTLDSRYCPYFCEVETMIGVADVALGLNFTWLPSRWGVYGSMLGGINKNYASLGPALRLVDYDAVCDWHLYGGVVVGDGVGGEVGMRFASPRHDGAFGWCSGSMGMTFLDGESYITFGLSLDLTAIVVLSLILL